MNDDLRSIFDAAVPPPPSAAGQAEAARRYARHRRRIRIAGASAITLTLVLPTLLVLREANDGPDVTSEVSCSGEVTVTEPFERPRIPAYATAREAALAWAGPGNADAIRMDGERVATLVREDGSVRARMRIEGSPDEDDPDRLQWSVDGSSVCADEISAEPWEGADLLDCPAGRKVVRAKVGTDDSDARYFPTEPRGLRVENGDEVSDPTRTPGSQSGDATSVTVRDGRAVIAVREVREADVWRIERIAACLPGPPNINGNAGIPSDFEWGVRRLRLSHCWPGPFELQGRTWVSRAQDTRLNLGYEPPHWFGYGVFGTVGGTRTLAYIDLGGADLTFVEQGSPDAYVPPSGCA